MGIEVRYNTKVGKDITAEEIFSAFDATFFAVGAHGGRGLGIENENIPGVLGGIDFLRASNKGEPIHTGKTVFVIGGGNVAIDVALTAVEKRRR